MKLASGDYIDLKMYEPAMRHLIDTYIRAEESEKISAFDDMTLIQLIVERGADAVNALPKGIRKNEEAVAETIENNVRKLIIDETPVNPKYYEKMSELLDALIEQRRKGAMSYKEYLEKIVELTKKATMPGGGPGGYPASVKTAAQRALYDNLDKDEALGAGGGCSDSGQPAGRLARQPDQDQEGEECHQGGPGRGIRQAAVRPMDSAIRTMAQDAYAVDDADTTRFSNW